MATEQTYTLDGPTDFYFPYPVREPSQITVSVQPGGVLPSSQYEVIGYSATAQGVTVRYANAPRDGSKSLIIGRRTELERVSDFPDDLSITARALNTEFNNIIQIVQDGFLSEYAGEWTPNTLFASLEIVTVPELGIYVARIGHESGADFATDLAADLWTPLIELDADFADLVTIANDLDGANTIGTVAGISTDVTTVADNSADVTTVAGISGNVTTVAGIDANVTTVAGNTTNINAVAGNATNINTVAGISLDVTDVADIATEVTAVDANATNINTVAGIDADVTTVAGIYGDVTIVATNVLDVTAVADNATNINTVAGIDGNVTTVAGIAGNVTSVAGNTTNINTVAGIDANITTVAGISADVSTVAGNTADISAVADNETNIDLVAADIADISTVAGISGDVTVVADNVVDVTNFAKVYLGPKTSNPTLRNDGTALESGDLYFNTSVSELRVYDLGLDVWVAVAAGTAVSADQITYDNTASGLTAEDVQDAVDEIAAKDFFGITTADITNWDTAYGWGDHALAGYYSDTNPDGFQTDAEVTATVAADAVAKTSGTGSAVVPTGTEAERDGTPAAGYFRFNSDAGQFEGYDGTAWGEIGGGGGATGTAGVFSKRAGSDSVAWVKTGNDTAETSGDLIVEVNETVIEIPEGTSISMPTLAVGVDYAIWAAPDGSLIADSSFSTPPVASARRVGGFHYASGGRATLDLNAGDGGTTAQIMDTSFYDLKWRPDVLDPRGLVLVGDGAFWAGIYHMSANHLTGAVHKYGVDPCRDGNSPQNLNGTGNYPNASPANIIEALEYHGFRAPNFWEFQLLAFGVNEERSIGGSGPGLTGDVSDRNKHQQTSAWGVFDATGVLQHWGNDTILTTSNQTLPNPSRGDLFRYSHFASFGGGWADGANSGSRIVLTRAATFSGAFVGSRGVCDHLILD